MIQGNYANFCPLSKACEIVEPRWSLLVLGEIWSGATHFNEIRRGLPAMSPTLLSRRLKDLEKHGVIDRLENPASGEISCLSTLKGDELAPIARALGAWAHRNVDTNVLLRHLDARVLMWNMRRKVDVAALPRDRRSVVQFSFPELPKDEREYWLIFKPGGPVDLCVTERSMALSRFIGRSFQFGRCATY